MPGHLIHDLLSEKAWKDRLSHAVHGSCPVEEYVPGAQGTV